MTIWRGSFQLRPADRGHFAELPVGCIQSSYMEWLMVTVERQTTWDPLQLRTVLHSSMPFIIIGVSGVLHGTV